MLRENSSKRKIIIIITFFIIGIILIIAGSFFKTSNTDFNKDKYVSDMENKLEDFLINVKGIKRVKVIITLDEYSNAYTDSFNNQLSEQYPTVRGVCVACSNGNDIYVQSEVTEIVSKYLGIGTNKVKITSIKQ